MGNYVSPKILGATIIGFALVAGAYVTSNFGQPHEPVKTATATQVVEPAPERIQLAITDTDQNGVEDWRDAFVDNEAVVIKSAPHASYTPPTTVTGQTTINFMEDIITARMHASPITPSDDDIIARNVAALDRVAEIKLYDTTDISIMEEWSEEDVVNYANTVAATVIRNDVNGLDSEMQILYDITRRGQSERISELEAIRGAYQGFRDETLLIPVPKELAKAHLDLINTYQALYEDLDAMIASIDDPLLGLVHIKRYDDDALGLVMAVHNLYDALLPYASLFTAEDPALLFAAFTQEFPLNNQ
ncbi:hypothetical protein KC851_03220 [Candidatus Kaiserbacteria bacterium]|nr:hypothetical protein [Candidatus Kaiserbacteria bacterium]